MGGFIEVLSQLLAPEMLLAAFAGGAFAAAIGALPAFVFTGILVIGGEAAVATGGPDDITGAIAFGPPFSPAISFAGGAAAAAFAARKGYMATGFPFHEAKNIAAAQGPKPDVMVVGGLFGIVGYWLVESSVALSLPWDPIAMGVVLSALAHRLVLGYPLVGLVRYGILDMTPFERGEVRRAAGVGGRAGAGVSAAQALDEETPEAGVDEVGTREGTGEADAAPAEGGDAPGGDGEAGKEPGGEAKRRFVVEPWLPHQYLWGQVATLGGVAGLFGAFVALASGSAFLPFGISAASLLFLNCGVARFPVTHHMTLPAATAALAVSESGSGLLADVGMAGAMMVGAVFGLVGALVAELFQRVFFAHGDTHWDPPAAAIVFGTFLVVVCYVGGIFPDPAWVPVP